jgi:hypothetical protein
MMKIDKHIRAGDAIKGSAMILVTLGSGMGEMWGSLTSLKLEWMCRPRLACGIQALLRQKV